MEKELIMNIVEDVNFLLTVVGLSLLLSCFASVLAVGHWEAIKELRSKHNMLCDNCDILDQNIIATASATNHNNDHIIVIVEELKKLAASSRNRDAVFLEFTQMTDDQINSLQQRLSHIEDKTGTALPTRSEEEFLN